MDPTAEAPGGDSGDRSSGRQRLAHYELLDKLGEGGMGIVYKARDTRLGRIVALKVLPPDKVGNARRKQRFVREAMLASALNHPNIVTIHDIASHGEGDFIVMELVEGRSLRDAIPKGGMEVARALDCAIQIADAMVAAHEAGIVHRDLKPHNVMVTEATGTGRAHGRVKVLDFGVAKLSPAASPGSMDTTLTQLTGRGETLGTLAYMSPEQLRGEPVDARSDIFSLGVMCYEMLTGRRPFQGATEIDLAHEIYFNDPEPMTRWRPELPAAVADVIMRMLRKQRADRQDDMAEVRTELVTLARKSDTGTGLAAPSTDDDQPLASNELTTREPGEQSGTLFDLVTPRRRSRWVLAAALAMLAALALVSIPTIRELGGGAGQATPIDQPPSARELYLQGLAQLEQHYQPGNLDLAIQSFQRMLAQDLQSAAGHAGLAKAYLNKYLEKDKDPSWRTKALANARRAVELNEDLAAARASLGMVLAYLDEIDEAREHLQAALLLNPFEADAYLGLGKTHERRGDLEEAEAVYRRGLEVRPDNRRLHDRLGRVLYRTGRYVQAEASFLRSLELAPDAPSSHKNLAAVYHMLGRFSQAADQLQRAIEVQPTAGLYSNLGTLYFYQGLYQEAVAAFEKTFDFAGSSNNYRRWTNLADAYRWTPDNEQKARDAYLRAIQLLREQLATAPENVEARSRLALALAKRGDCQQSIVELAKLDPLDTLGATLQFRTTVAFEICGRRLSALRSLELALTAGYSLEEIKREPELLELRDDLRYHHLVMKLESQ